MSDLTEALAAIGPLIEPIDGVPYGVTISADSPIVEAARKWADLEAQVADGARVYVEIPCPDERGVEHPGCNYLAHVICNKCGWVQGPHDCAKATVILGEGASA